MDALKRSGGPSIFAPSRAPSCAGQYDEPTPTLPEIQQALCAERPPPSNPDGDGSDCATAEPSGLNGGGRYLEGSPPMRFNGDQSKASLFLARFKGFMLINGGADIARDPVKKSAYFLSLVEGPDVEAWLVRNYDWLDSVDDEDPQNLRPGLDAWKVLERDFKSAFVDLAEQDRNQALDELIEIRMKQGKVDDYIAAFRKLGNRAGIDLDSPIMLHFFASGLQGQLAESCIEKHSPKTFTQWAQAAQKEQREFKLSKQPVRNFWSRKNRPTQSTHPGPSLPIGAAYIRTCVLADDPICPATTEADKGRYRKEGRCYECGEKGHVVKMCPELRLRD